MYDLLQKTKSNNFFPFNLPPTLTVFFITVQTEGVYRADFHMSFTLLKLLYTGIFIYAITN